MSNVIQFPKGKLNAPPQNLEEIMETVEASRKEHIEMFLSVMVPYIFQKACDEGFDITQQSCIETNTFFLEALNAALCKSVGIYHPIHDVVSDIINDSDFDPNTNIFEPDES